MKFKIYKLMTTAVFLIVACATFAAAPQTNRTNKQIAVKIYLQKTEIDPSGMTSLETAPVKRKVNAADSLRATLEALFAPPTEKEKRQRFSSATTGTKFEGVELKDGTALVKFSEPPGDVSADLFVFRRAIEQTAKQFRAVKRVEICAVGETLIDSESANPFPRCPPSPEK